MELLDRFERPFPEPEKHRRAVGFVAATTPLREDDDTLTGIAPAKPSSTQQDNDPIMGV